MISKFTNAGGLSLTIDELADDAIREWKSSKHSLKDSISVAVAGYCEPDNEALLTKRVSERVSEKLSEGLVAKNAESAKN